MRLSFTFLHVLWAEAQPTFLQDYLSKNVYVTNSLKKQRQCFLQRKGWVCTQFWKDEYSISLKSKRQVCWLSSRILKHKFPLLLNNHCMFRAQLASFHHLWEMGIKTVLQTWFLRCLLFCDKLSLVFDPRISCLLYLTKKLQPTNLLAG